MLKMMELITRTSKQAAAGSWTLLGDAVPYLATMQGDFVRDGAVTCGNFSFDSEQGHEYLITVCASS